MTNTTILSNLLSFIPRHKFNRFVKKYDGDKHSKKVKVYEHFTSILYGVIGNIPSLRSVETSFNSNHRSFDCFAAQEIHRSTMSYYNQREDLVKIYKDVFDNVLKQALDNDKISREEYIQTGRVVNIIDSTEIRLNANSKTCYPSKHKADKSHIKVHVLTNYAKDLPKEIYFSEHNVNDITVAKNIVNISKNEIYIFDRGYYDFSWWKKIDDRGSIFITRLKKNSPCNKKKSLTNKFIDPNIISDSSFTLNTRLSKTRKNPYKKRLREVLVKDEQGKLLRLLTNDFKSSAEQISNLYKTRWSIELFFKWIKQNLKIKKFYGYSKTAIKIQILIAMIGYILLKLLKATLNIKQSFIEYVNICKAHIMEKVKNILLFFFPPPAKRTKKEHPHNIQLCLV
jgi:putative transposase